MAMQMSEGFDQYDAVADLLIRHVTSTASGFTTTGGRFGGGAYTSNNDDLPLQMPLGALVDASSTGGPIHVAFWFKTTALPSATDVIVSFGIASGSGTGDFGLTPLGEIEHYQFGSIFSPPAVTAPVITAGVWHHIEITTQYSNTGSIKLWVDGVSRLDATVDNYSSVVPSDIDRVQLEGHTNGTCTFDDVVVWDETGTDFVIAHMNEHQIETLVPDGDSAVQFTPTGTGTTNADRVSETGFHDGDTTYVESTTVGHVDRYTLANQASTPTVTHALAVHTRAKKTDAGAVTLHNHMRHGTTTLEGQDHALTNSYGHYADYYGKNPDTAAAWGTTDVNTAEAGIEYQA